MSTSMIVAVTSLFIAFLSIIFSIVTIIQTRKHNRLSVKPLLQIIATDLDDYLSVSLFNAGTGPAVRVPLFITSKVKGSNYLIDFIPEDIKLDNYSKFDKYVIAPKDFEPLIELKGDKNDQAFIIKQKKVREALKDVNIRIWYRDVYGTKFEEELSLNRCFGRHS